MRFSMRPWDPRGEAADGWSHYGAWESWMEHVCPGQDRDPEKYKSGYPSVLESVEDYSTRIELYSVMCELADGSLVPWHRRLWFVLTEPVRVLRWWLVSWWRGVKRDLLFLRQYRGPDYRMRVDRSGRWPGLVVERLVDGQWQFACARGRLFKWLPWR